MKYFISDPHFGHGGSLKWPNGKGRKFNSVEEMNSVIINNWNKTVTNEDEIYCLGDFSYKSSKKMIIDVMKSLNGKIIFITGNHDYDTLEANKIIHRFDSIHNILEFESNEAFFVLCHYPIYSWRLKNRGSIHLHGHVHGEPTGISGNIMDVSCEVINYTPISIDEVISKFKQNES